MAKGFNFSVPRPTEVWPGINEYVWPNGNRTHVSVLCNEGYVLGDTQRGLAPPRSKMTDPRWKTKR